MQSISRHDEEKLVTLLNPAINFREFSNEDLDELKSFVEHYDINHELRLALKKKISGASRPVYVQKEPVQTITL